MKKEYDNQLVIGRNPVLELIKSNKPVEKIFIQKGLRGPFEVELRNLLKGRNIPVSYVHPNKLKSFTTLNHQGVVAISSLIEYWELDDLIDHVYHKGEVPNFILLDSITDVRNTGSIIRSAEVLGANGVILGTKNSAIINHAAIKASAGAIYNIPLVKTGSIVNTIQTLKDNGINVYASNLHAHTPLYDLDMKSPVCTVLGSEDKGIGKHISKLATKEFIIPQKGKTDSLNVAVAAGIILYEILVQRSKQ